MSSEKCLSADSTFEMSETVVKAHITLQDLLKDSRFQDVQQEGSLNTQQAQYSTCINLYIKGDKKACLERMFTYELLAKETLRSNLNIWKLFLSICFDTPFEVFGVSIQNVLKREFSVTDIPQVRSLVQGEPIGEQIGIMIKYLTCILKCHSFFVAEETARPNDLETSTRDFIINISGTAQTKDDVRQLKDLVEFYLLDLQVTALRKRKSPALYEDICEQVPGLHSQFSVENGGNPTFEAELLTKLSDPIKKKSRKALRKKKSKSLPMGTPAPSTLGVTKNLQPLDVPKTLRWLHSLKKLLSFRHSSRALAVIILAILFSVKRAQTLSIIANRGIQATKVLFKYIYNIIQILLSI